MEAFSKLLDIITIHSSDLNEKRQPFTVTLEQPEEITRNGEKTTTPEIPKTTKRQPYTATLGHTQEKATKKTKIDILHKNRATERQNDSHVP